MGFRFAPEHITHLQIGHFDFATSQGLEIESVETLPRGASDHLPILISAEYGQDSNGNSNGAAPAAS